MILERKPLTLGEVKSMLPKSDEKRPIDDYLKKFSKTSPENSVKIKEEVLALNNPKIKEYDAVKISDLLPKNQEELNKIFNDVSFDEEEATKILEIVKSHAK